MRAVETITSPKSGRTTYKIRFRLDGKQTSETFPSRRDAESFAKALDALGAREAVDRLYSGEARDKIPMLDEVAADHIRLLTGIEHGTRLGYTRDWARTWGYLFGRTPADQVGADLIRQAVNDLAEGKGQTGTPYATKSLENLRGLLAGVLDRCVEKGYLVKNPAKGIRLPEGKRIDVDSDEDDDTEMVCLTHGGWDRLYESMSPHYRAFVRFLVGTGCRWGEAIVLRVKDFDLEKGIVRIRRALKWSSDGTKKIGPPKTKKGRRTIKLAPENVADVRALIAGKQASDFVFTQARGSMLIHRNFWSRYWKPAIFKAQHCDQHLAELVAQGCKCGTSTPARCLLHKNAPQPEPCGCEGTLLVTPRIHDLRHTHASWLLADGVPIHVVQARLGHESIQTTVDTYSHLLPDAQLLAASAASAVFGGRAAIQTKMGGPKIHELTDDELCKLAAVVAAEARGRALDLSPAAIEAA